jgi:glucose-6-phosphate dehydrogenase assembly protein OpcA
MAGTVADRTWRESALDAIESDLAALWRELAQHDVKIARAVMSNLIVVRAPSDDRRSLTDIVAGLPLDEVAARHPSRTIVLEHCQRKALVKPFAAGVGIVTFGPAAARYGVEQIVVRSACPEPSLLSILRRLVRGDVPTSVWWTEDLSDGPPFEPLLTVGRQLLYDSRQWSDVRRGLAAIRPLVDSRRVDLADLNWRRLTPMRRALVHARGPLKGDAWRNVAIHVSHAAGEPAIAWLLDGWLRAERPGDRGHVAIEASRDSGADAILTVTVGDATATLTARSAEVSSPSAPPLVVAVPQESHGDAIAAELRSLSPDITLLAAIRALGN